MSNITTSLNQRCTLIPKIDLTTESHVELMLEIFKKHGEENLTKVKLIDENDSYDSFLVETEKNSFIVKTALDQTDIFYEFMIVNGIENLYISPIAIDRNQIEFGKTIYYTIQTYEHSDNINTIGISNLLNENYSENFEICLNILHKFVPPKEVLPYLDDNRSYLEYHKINFKNLTQYVDSTETLQFEFIESVYNEIYDEMMTLFNAAESSLKQKTLVHGNLNSSTIISNNSLFKFINFENTFYGNPFFDLCNIVFELQATGINEFDFISKRLKQMQLTENRLKSKDLLQEYKTCKYIWTRKKLLDLARDYFKEVVILNKTRIEKMQKLGNEFSKHFYRFDEIKAFQRHKDLFVSEFSALILNK